MWEDLSTHMELNKMRSTEQNLTPPSYRVARLNCARATEVCHRLHITGFPTLSVLDGAAIYDY